MHENKKYHTHDNGSFLKGRQRRSSASLGKYDLIGVEGTSIRAHYVCIKVIYMCKISKNYIKNFFNLENNYKEKKSGRKQDETWVLGEG